MPFFFWPYQLQPWPTEWHGNAEFECAHTAGKKAAVNGKRAAAYGCQARGLHMQSTGHVAGGAPSSLHSLICNCDAVDCEMHTYRLSGSVTVARTERRAEAI